MIGANHKALEQQPSGEAVVQLEQECLVVGWILANLYRTAGRYRNQEL